MLTYDELRDVVDAIEGRRRVRLAHDGNVGEVGDGSARGQARPGSVVQAVTPGSSGLGIQAFTWGFDAPDGKKLVFNTRIESALGGSRMWAEALRNGRCILPAASFFERQWEFAAPDETPLLLASVQQHGRISVVTTEPNAAVSPVHHRMPLALRFEEVRAWLGDGFAMLSDRSSLELIAKRENGRPGNPGSPGRSGRIDPAQLSLF